jgi:membrane protease YdiL (CAAX protease family)
MPEATSYGVAVLAVTGVGASGIAEMFGGLRFAHAYGLVLALVALWGGFVFEPGAILGRPRTWPLAVVVGLVLGAVAARADLAVVRRSLRRRRSGGAVFTAGSGTVADAYGFGLSSLVLIAGLEEVIYRGWLLQACRLVPSTLLSAVAVGASLLAFSLVHLRFGWTHVLAKTPLGTLALAGVLVTGSVVAAIVAHVEFNVRRRPVHARPAPS